MASRFLIINTGRNVPRIIGQSREPEPSTINEKTIADFTRVVEQTGILHPQERYDSEVGSRTERTASNGTAREQAMKKISENPRFKEAPSSWDRVRDRWSQDHHVKKADRALSKRV